MMIPSLDCLAKLDFCNRLPKEPLQIALKRLHILSQKMAF